MPPSQMPSARIQCPRPARTAIPTVSTPERGQQGDLGADPEARRERRPGSSGPAPTPASTRGSPVTGTSVDHSLLGMLLVGLRVEAGLAVLGHRRPLRPLRRLGRPGYLRGGPAVAAPLTRNASRASRKKSPIDVVGRVAGLRADEHLGVEHDRGAEQGGGADRVGAPDAPRRQQRERQPAEVDQRRERSRCRARPSPIACSSSEFCG